MSGDFDFEPIRGLPEVPPEGERILWQGAPDWRELSWRAFHVREAAFYFAVLLSAQPTLAVLRKEPLAASLPAMGWLSLAAVLALGLLTGLGWASARSTVYTITSRRLVLRIGIALPVTINLPFALIARAGVTLRRNGGGDLPIGLVPGERVSWAVLWPHLRPWRLARPEPMLRAVPDAAHVAEILGRALAAHAGVHAAGSPIADIAGPEARLPPGVAAAR